MESRYVGKPLLRILECYVLFAIDELPKQDQEHLNQITPKLRDIYRESGSWDEIIKSVMHFPNNMPSLIGDMWEKNRKVAESNKITLSADQFAKTFVDQNFDI